MFLWTYVLEVNCQKKKEHIPVMFVCERLRLFQHLRNFKLDSLSQSLIHYDNENIKKNLFVTFEQNLISCYLFLLF